VYVVKKTQENYRDSFNEGAYFGLMTTSADVNWFTQEVSEEDYVSYQEAVLIMLEAYSEETVKQVNEEAANLFKREYLLDREFKEISDVTGFREGYLIYSSIGILSMSFELGEITEEEYEMLQEEMGEAVENPNHINVRIFLDHFMELVDLKTTFGVVIF